MDRCSSTSNALGQMSGLQNLFSSYTLALFSQRGRRQRAHSDGHSIYPRSDGKPHNGFQNYLAPYSSSLELRRITPTSKSESLTLQVVTWHIRITISAIPDLRSYSSWSNQVYDTARTSHNLSHVNKVNPQNRNAKSTDTEGPFRGDGEIDYQSYRPDLLLSSLLSPLSSLLKSRG
jgi:hypothetical protein